MVAKKQLDILSRARINFYASYSQPGGGGEMTLSPSDVLRYLSDKESVIANHLGVSPDEYMLWLDSEGTVFCSGTTKTGNRCRNMVSRPQLSIEEWVELTKQAPRCKSHGG